MSVQVWFILFALQSLPAFLYYLSVILLFFNGRVVPNKAFSSMIELKVSHHFVLYLADYLPKIILSLEIYP